MKTVSSLSFQFASRCRLLTARLEPSSLFASAGHRLRTLASSVPPPPPPHLESDLPKLEDPNPERIRGIHVNPDSLGSKVLPGNLVYKTYKLSGNTRKVPLELVHGYFWMLNDLKATGQKPTLSNETLISENDAQVFPILQGACTLANPDMPIVLPAYFTTGCTNGNQQVTLLALTFRDHGFKMLPSWTQPFSAAFRSNPIVQTYTLSVTERWALYPFRNLLTKVVKSNTPREQHAQTLVQYTRGADKLDDFRDILRLHNLMTCYVFLLDGRGRVRFAGSGEAFDNELGWLVGMTKELLEEQELSSGNYKRSKKGKMRR